MCPLSPALRLIVLGSRPLLDCLESQQDLVSSRAAIGSGSASRHGSGTLRRRRTSQTMEAVPTAATGATTIRGHSAIPEHLIEVNSTTEPSGCTRAPSECVHRGSGVSSRRLTCRARTAARTGQKTSRLSWNAGRAKSVRPRTTSCHAKVSTPNAIRTPARDQ